MKTQRVLSVATVVKDEVICSFYLLRQETPVVVKPVEHKLLLTDSICVQVSVSIIVHNVSDLRGKWHM